MRLGRLLRFLCVFFWGCVQATSVYSDGKSVWEGVFVEGQLGLTAGTHTLAYGLEKLHFNADLYEISMVGSTAALGLGYRQQVSNTPLYWGLYTTAYVGELSGTQSWSYVRNAVGAQVAFSADTVYTFSGELGYTPAPRWYCYVRAGVAAAHVSLGGSAHLLGLSVSDSLDGWALGTYVATGVKYDLGHNWAAGFVYQQFMFAGSEDVVLRRHTFGTLDATLRQSQIALTLEYRF